MTSLPNQGEAPPTSPDTIAPDPSLYDQLGGEPAVTTVVERFYQRILEDSELAPLFAPVDLDRLKAHQVAMFTRILGGPDRYGGRSLAAAHRRLDISDDQYDRVGGHLTAVLDELGVGDQARETVASALAAVRPDVVAPTTAPDPA